jgi:hypothetical protein
MIDGHRIKNAKKTFVVHLTESDVSSARIKDPDNCAAARAVGGERAVTTNEQIMRDALDEIFSIVSYINIHGVGEQPEPTLESGPQPMRCPSGEFQWLFQRIGKLSSDALAKTEG